MRRRVSLTIAALSAALASAYAGFYLRGEAPPELIVSKLQPTRAGSTPIDDDVLDRLLARFVDEQGLVDYTGLTAARGELETWLAQVGAHSPDSHPDLFPTRAAQLAYWLNAYNGWSLYLVTEPGSAGPAGQEQLEFFVRRRVRVGGRTISLFDLDHDIIRGRFGDPRSRFALNFGAMGGPALSREAYRSDRLDEQLDLAARRFCLDERHLRIREGQVEVSAIFDWYAQDFDAAGGPIGFCEQWGRSGLPLDGDVSYLPFDWTLNAQPGRAVGESEED